MKRTLFDISSDERKRILEMHENATKKNYVMEQGTPTPSQPTTRTSGSATTATTNTIIQLEKGSPAYRKFIDFSDGSSLAKAADFFGKDSLGSVRWRERKGTTEDIITDFNKIIQTVTLYYADNKVSPEKPGFSFIEVAQSRTPEQYNKVFKPNDIAQGSTTLKLPITGANTKYKNFFNWNLSKAFA